MRKILILIILIVFLLPNIPVLATLKIYKNNSHFLEYNGQPTMIFNFGFDTGNKQHTKNMISTGLDTALYTSSRKYCGVQLADVNSSQFAYTDGDMRKGFNENAWTWFKNNVVEKYKNEGKLLIINLWATTMLEEGDPYGNSPISKYPGCINYYIHAVEKDKIYSMSAEKRKSYLATYWAPGRFDANVWSDLNGGPLPTSEGHPKDNFYTLANPNTFYSLTDNCSNLNTWQKKNQCYQDQYIRKFFQVMGSYGNWMIQPMYEIDDTGGTSKQKMYQWVEHVKALIRSLDNDVMIVYEGGKDSVLVQKFDVISQQGTVSGINYPFELRNKIWSWNKPLYYTGFDPLDKTGTRMDNQKAPWNSFTTEDYINNIGWGCNLEVMRNFVLSGISPAPIFHMTDYDKEGYMKNYAIKLSKFLETVETWDNEPGDEITDATVPATGFASCGSINSTSGTETPDTGDTELDSSEVKNYNFNVDLNNDNRVDIMDFGILLSFWKKSYDLILTTTNKSVDLNGDNIVDILDIGALLSHWTK